MFRRISLAIGAASLALSMAATGVLAGQPSVSCGDVQLAPPGFSSVGFLKAEAVYANLLAQGGLSSGNSHVVAQYDIACIHFTAAHQ